MRRPDPYDTTRRTPMQIAYAEARECARRAWYALGIAELLRADGDARGQAYVLECAFMWLDAADQARSLARFLRG